MNEDATATGKTTFATWNRQAEENYEWFGIHPANPDLTFPDPPPSQSGIDPHDRRMQLVRSELLLFVRGELDDIGFPRGTLEEAVLRTWLRPHTLIDDGTRSYDIHIYEVIVDGAANGKSQFVASREGFLHEGGVAVRCEHVDGEWFLAECRLAQPRCARGRYEIGEYF